MSGIHRSEDDLDVLDAKRWHELLIVPNVRWLTAFVVLALQSLSAAGRLHTLIQTGEMYNAVTAAEFGEDIFALVVSAEKQLVSDHERKHGPTENAQRMMMMIRDRTTSAEALQSSRKALAMYIDKLQQSSGGEPFLHPIMLSLNKAKGNSRNSIAHVYKHVYGRFLYGCPYTCRYTCR